MPFGAVIMDEKNNKSQIDMVEILEGVQVVDKLLPELLPENE